MSDALLPALDPAEAAPSPNGDAAPAFAFGDRVLFTRHLRRHSDWRQGRGAYPGQHVKVWTAEGYPGQPEPEPRPGILIGRRTLADGHVVWDHETGGEFTAERRFTAYLVAFDLHRRPLLVLPQHLTPAPTEGADR